MAESTKRKGRPGQGRPSTIIINHEPQERSSTLSQAQPLKHFAKPRHEKRETLHVIKPGHPVRTLLAVGIGFANEDIARAAKLYDALMASKEHYYRSRGRRVPTEAEIDAERYPVARPRKGVARA